MPRRRPGHIRAGIPRRTTPDAKPVIDGLSSRAMFEISHLERTRNYLQPGDIGKAVRLWKDYVHRPQGQLWHDHEWGNSDWDCWGSPFEARALLDTAMRAMTPRSARELRRIISRFDTVWNQPSPPYGADGG
ncbi:hypothetical protein [Streptomyces sp. NBC_00620]|uniref:hypothetical protein n=1 Tax=Streptomyces sp. NBC_00620 TaxID=2903666 RepID=UPI0022594688|nr:hypothetical protein [Streptomyces sp. NBC_00620]MCX4973798.1 hypothetical protein [Streptomyces sp. NBC_00620]